MIKTGKVTDSENIELVGVTIVKKVNFDKKK